MIFGLAKSADNEGLICNLIFCCCFFMPPTSKKLRGHIGLGLSVQSVSQSVSQSVMHEH